LAISAAVMLAACGGGGIDPKSADPVQTPQATPVSVATVELATLVETVTAPGSTVILVEQQVRAPFSGVLTALDVVEGDRVARGKQIGKLVARDSEAAVRGAEEMVRQAMSDQERTDAERALELARRHRVEVPLVATVSGVVTSRAASAGDLVAEDQELVTIAAADSLVFRANLAQSELARIRPGQTAAIDLPGSAQPLAGRVHGLLAGPVASDLTAPVRIDLVQPAVPLVTGLFATVRIVIAEHRAVPVVPSSAVLRDDLSGETRIATVDGESKLHWVTVETGLRQGDRIEIVRPPLSAGEQVVTSGQIGLEEGTALVVQP
jgi:multidrug efflux pump subunit AcrA (membrane-fusion protein)